MKLSIKRGFSFGLTSGIITTLGLIVGLNSGTGSKMVILGGILTIAIADAFSDAMGVHISEESGSKRITDKEVWQSTIATFVSKLFFALTFLIPFLLFDLTTAIYISIIWGLLLVGIFSFYMARLKDHNPWHATIEHLTITVVVIVLSTIAGNFISSVFGS